AIDGDFEVMFEFTGGVREIDVGFVLAGPAGISTDDSDSDSDSVEEGFRAITLVFVGVGAVDEDLESLREF
ncbi:unnamed protein product, partial [Rotaria socialis]